MVSDTQSTTRERPRGKGWHGDPKAHAKAGKKGGLSTYELHGSEFYQKIGAKGGSISPGNFKHNPGRAARAGRTGGKAK